MGPSQLRNKSKVALLSGHKSPRAPVGNGLTASSAGGEGFAEGTGDTGWDEKDA